MVSTEEEEGKSSPMFRRGWILSSCVCCNTKMPYFCLSTPRYLLLSQAVEEEETHVAQEEAPLLFLTIPL